MCKKLINSYGNLSLSIAAKAVSALATIERTSGLTVRDNILYKKKSLSDLANIYIS